jgi:hypothetical protein
MSWMQNSWMQEFVHSQACFIFVRQQIAKANQEINTGGGLELVIVDACSPDQYQQGHRVLVTNNWIAPEQLDSTRYEQFPASWYGLYAGATNTQPHKPTKKFNCFINRMDPIRQSWFYQLIRRNLFDQGLVSFNMDISRHIVQGRCAPTDTPQQVFEQQFHHHLQIFHSEHEKVKTMVPYRNFDCDLQTAIMQTEFSIVLETYFDRNEVITFSEKIFRCLKLPRPWVIFAMQNAVSYLRDMGFDVLDDLVNHSYDTVGFAIERQTAILDQVELMCRQTLTESDIRRCQQAADHNQALLAKMYSNFHEDVNNACSNALDKCRQL